MKALDYKESEKILEESRCNGNIVTIGDLWKGYTAVRCIILLSFLQLEFFETKRIGVGEPFSECFFTHQIGDETFLQIVTRKLGVLTHSPSSFLSESSLENEFCASLQNFSWSHQPQRQAVRLSLGPRGQAGSPLCCLTR